MSDLKDIEMSFMATSIDFSETTYKGMIINSYELEDDNFNIVIKKPCGEIIHTMEEIHQWEIADTWADGVIEGYLIGLKHNRE